MAQPLPPRQEAEIFEKYQSRFQARLIGVVSPILFFAAVCFSFALMPQLLVQLADYMLVIKIALGLEIVTAIILNFIIWRCPSCKGLFGKEFNPNFCRHCGVKLHE